VPLTLLGAICHAKRRRINMSLISIPTSFRARSKFLGLLSVVGGVFFLFLFYTQSYFNYSIVGKISSSAASHIQPFIDTKFGFQQDLSLKLPEVDFIQYKDYTPHHHKPEIKQETFSTFFCSLNASVHDPYFAATLNLVYRNLWSPTSASKSRPFTVFVAPFVSQEQRDIFAGAGAIVQELALLPWQPHITGVWGRWRDQFSKLHFWNQTQYSAVVYLDSDAFTIANIDSVFDDVKPQRCNETKLDPDDVPFKDELCDYTFAGVGDLGGGVNGGFLVVVPDTAMYDRLIRNYVRVDEYDNSYAEQSFFRWQFAPDGPFPAQILPRKYNAFFPTPGDEGVVNVIHEKLWAFDNGAEWVSGIWASGWKEMREFYDSEAFKEARALDGPLFKASVGSEDHSNDTPEPID
jgi:inositol 3-alpha-galactosyltransferase